MTIPAIFFGLVLSTTYGTAFHVWKGGGMKKLFLFIILAWLGFILGHITGGILKWNFAAVGPVNVGMATLGSVVFLFVGEWLSRVEIARQ
jgi:hypothetical protein